MTDTATILLTGIAIFYTSLFAVLLGALVLRLYRSEHSGWYYVGAASSGVSFFVRNPVNGSIAAIVAIIVVIQFWPVVEGLPDGDNDDTNPPPEIAPIYADTLQMPTDYPFERFRLAWPAFFGHQFSLGGDRA